MMQSMDVNCVCVCVGGGGEEHICESCNASHLGFMLP